MVRLLAAGLVEVGHGRVTPLQLQGILRKGQRDALPEAAPPHGLYLMQVRGRRGQLCTARVVPPLGMLLATLHQQSSISRRAFMVHEAAQHPRLCMMWLLPRFAVRAGVL
jgi:hypothetical protein